MSMNWEDRFLIGVESIDNQHRRLVELMVNLMEAVKTGKGRSIISPVLQELIDYTRTHFVDEEGIMTRYNYPDILPHKQDHDRFVQEITKAAREYVEKKAVPTQKILSFLAQWLVDHIMGYDQKLGDFLIDNGVR